MSSVKLTLTILLAISMLAGYRSAMAAPWIEPGAAQLRHHIQVLADGGILHAPITTWPLPWAALVSDIEQANATQLTDAQRWSLAYVKFYLQQAKSNVRMEGYAGSQGDPVVLRDFGSHQREENEVRGSLDWVGEIIAGRIALTWAPDATDNKDYRLDGTYLAAVLGNWSVNVGAIDRWWGPGWNSSLILSSNARPVTALSLSRQNASRFETPLLSWMGPWTFTTFAGQLESHRAVPDARLLGWRFALKPFAGFELGFSRTGQWGGDNRPESFSSLWDLMIAETEFEGEGAGQDPDDVPGNWLGAIDWRWAFAAGDCSAGFYGQYAGEDESNGLPSRSTHLMGLEGAMTTGRFFHHLALEYRDTMTDGHRDPTADYSYEHAIYQSGYRYFGRSLGAAVDNDTRSITFIGDHFLTDDSALHWKITRLQLNRDQGNRTGIGSGSPFLAESSTVLGEISFSKTYKRLKLATTVYNVGHEFRWNNHKIAGTGLGVSLEYRSK